MRIGASAASSIVWRKALRFSALQYSPSRRAEKQRAFRHSTQTSQTSRTIIFAEKNLRNNERERDRRHIFHLLKLLQLAEDGFHLPRAQYLLGQHAKLVFDLRVGLMIRELVMVAACFAHQ